MKNQKASTFKKYYVTLLVLLTIPLSFSQALAWGDRGHHTIAQIAAKLKHAQLKPKDPESPFALYLKKRALMLGLYSNIPDMLWKDSAHRTPLQLQYNPPTHYFSVEYLLGDPTKSSMKNYLKKFDKIPLSYDALVEKYHNQSHPLSATSPQDRKTLDIYQHMGTNPWRVEDLFQYAVEALKCFKGKEPQLKPAKYPKVESLIADKPLQVVRSYQCQTNTSGYDDLYTATQFLGLLSHFVGDLSQPLHITMNFDGWYTGNSGIHAYFEAVLVSALGEDLNQKVYQLAQSPTFQKKILKEIQPTDKNHPIVQMMIQLSRNAYQDLPKILALDQKNALIHKGSQIPWGESPFLIPLNEKRYAQRKPVNKKILNAFENLIVKRLAIGSIALSEVWSQAWEAAGRPSFDKVSAVDAIPYAQNVPFVWPQYTHKEVERSMASGQ